MIEVGDYVRVELRSGLATNGYVEELRDGRVIVRVGKLPLTVDKEQVHVATDPRRAW